MPLEHEFFSQEQIAALHNLAKERGIPVDSMRFNEVIDYLYKNEYTSIGMLLFSSAVAGGCLHHNLFGGWPVRLLTF
ncbi:hypothetical protein [uncultured Desulfovibrio sp.]|uniref:hypothetical protein n=1 Tax=uncultured Desulfovibrio sp. TaxID=167968 RepID=UPI00262F2B70|nr:hypothetical protein [uncultured Desulfovibrio sp.]